MSEITTPEDQIIELMEEIVRLRQDVESAKIYRRYEDLAKYDITSIPDVGGVRLKCKRDTCPWDLRWPAHVEAPSLMHLTVQADVHTRREHGS